MVNKRPQSHRRRVFVRRVQLRFVLASPVFVCLNTALFLLILFGPLVSGLFDPSLSFEEQAQVANAFLALHSRVWVGVAVMSGLSLAYLALLSHRVAGPLVRFSNVFRAVGAGNVSMRVRVRKKDYLQEEAAGLDSMVHSLRRRLQATKGRAVRLEAALEDLRAAIPPGSECNLQRALKSVGEQARLLRQRLDGFHT